MRAFIYAADLHCETCGDALRQSLARPEGMDPDDECTWDSDAFPKGPYSEGGGEADTPSHCGSCGVFLENPLTPDGDAYARAAILEASGLPDDGEHAWSDHAEAAERNGRHVAAEWARHYFAWGH